MSGIIPDGMIEQIDRLIALREKQGANLREIKHLLMLADVVGIPPRDIKGRLSTALHTFGRPLYSKPWLENELVVNLDGEEVARKKLVDVPLDLWPADVRAEFERQQKRNNKT